jgi:hypothetical protein
VAVGRRNDDEQADVSAEARRAKADVAQLAERVLGKDEVSSSILDIGSILRSPRELGRQASAAGHRSASRAGGLAGHLDSEGCSPARAKRAREQ